jgi:hypothetical protein
MSNLSEVDRLVMAAGRSELKVMRCVFFVVAVTVGTAASAYTLQLSPGPTCSVQA